MPAQDAPAGAAPIRTAVVTASAKLRESISDAETAALGALDRVQSTLDDAQGGIAAAYLAGGDVLGALDHAGRTTLNGFAEITSIAVQHGRAAYADALEVGQKSLKAQCATELATLHADYLARRANAYFAAIAEINGLAQERTRTAWQPFGQVLSGKVQDEAGPATASAPKPRAKRAA